jgi:hypothetical protein
MTVSSSGNSATTNQGTADLVLRPIQLRRSTGQWIAASGWALSSAFFLVRFHGLALIVVGAISLLALIAMLLWTRSLRRQLQLALRGGTLYYGTPRERAVFEVGETAEIVELTVDHGNGPRDSWSLVDGTGHPRVVLLRAAWDAGQLADLGHRLGVPMTRREGRYSLQQANKEFPGIVPPWLARPQLLGALIAVGLIVVITAIALALGAK